MKSAYALILALIACALMPGCTHAPKVVNLDAYPVTLTEGPRQNVAILPFEGEPGNMAIFQGLVEKIREHPSVAQVRTNWKWGMSEPGFKPDVVAKIVPRAEYSGSGWNLPITFPGFLVAANAWHGFIYYADIKTDVRIYDPVTRKELKSEAADAEYELHYCDSDRGFTTHTGWWVPGWGASSFLFGLYNMTYDSDATEPFIQCIKTPYGNYVAEKMMAAAVEIARGKGRMSPLAQRSADLW